MLLCLEVSGRKRGFTVFFRLISNIFISISDTKMTFWQENYPFIKDVYIMRQTKMIEWMENVEKAISRIMADKVYTSAEFKRERDNFHVSKRLSHKWLFISFPCIFLMIWLGTLQRFGESRSEKMVATNLRNLNG